MEPMAKYDAVETAKTRYDLALENQRAKFQKFNDFEYIYHSKLKKADPNTPSKVFNPILWSFIETIISRMLAKKPVVAYKPREEMDQEQADLLSELFSYWYTRSDAFIVLSDCLKQALIYGTAIIKIDWLTTPPRTVKSYQLDPITGEAVFDPTTNQFVTETNQVIDYDDPRIQNVNIYDFFVDPNATSIDDAGWVIHQYYATIKELEDLNATSPEPLYNPSALKKLKDSQSTGGKDEVDAFEKARKEASGYVQTTADRSLGRIKIWEMWEDDKVCIIANESIILREADNPYWHGKKPFIRYIDSSNTLEFYGKGEIEPVEKMVHALNTLINQRITNINQILAPIWKAKANIDETELQFIPNNIIHVADQNDAVIEKQQDVTASSFQEQGVIVETIQRALGVTDYIQGVQTPGQTKAEVEIKTSQANARFASKLMVFEEMVLKELGEMIYALYQQYITKEKIIRVVGNEGEQFIRLTPKDLVGQFDVIPESGSTLETDQEEDFRKFFNLAAYLITKPYINQMEVDKELVQRAGEKDPERYFIQQGEDGSGILSAILGANGAGAPTTPPAPQPEVADRPIF